MLRSQGMWRASTLAAGFVVIACGGLVSEDGPGNTDQSSSRPDAASGDGDAGAAGTYGGQLPATCGEWLDAVSEAADQCGTFLYVGADFDLDRVLSPELAREICMPALRETTCDSDVRGYTPDACEDACR